MCLFFFFFFRLGAIIFVGETMSRKGFSLSFAWLIKRDRLVYVMASLPPSGVNYARLTAARWQMARFKTNIYIIIKRRKKKGKKYLHIWVLDERGRRGGIRSGRRRLATCNCVRGICAVHRSWTFHADTVWCDGTKKEKKKSVPVVGNLLLSIALLKKHTHAPTPCVCVRAIYY